MDPTRQQQPDSAAWPLAGGDCPLSTSDITSHPGPRILFLDSWYTSLVRTVVLIQNVVALPSHNGCLAAVRRRLRLDDRVRHVEHNVCHQSAQAQAKLTSTIACAFFGRGSNQHQRIRHWDTHRTICDFYLPSTHTDSDQRARAECEPFSRSSSSLPSNFDTPWTFLLLAVGTRWRSSCQVVKSGMTLLLG